MDLVTRLELELVDSVMAERRREARRHTMGRLAAENRRAAATTGPSLADRISTVFGRTTQPANCLCA